MEDLVGTAEAARILDRVQLSVIRYAKAGRLKPAGKLGGPNGAFVFRREDVEALRDELHGTEETVV